MNNNKPCIAAAGLGRLGNQMFITVAAMTFAKRTNREFLGIVKVGEKSDYPENVEKTVMRNVKYLDYFDLNGFTTFGVGPWTCNGFPKTNSEKVYFYDYFQDVNCIDSDIAYGLFAPYDSIINTINELYGDLSDYVCVQVRRGDYLYLKDYGFNVLSKDEIDTIIETYFPCDKIIFVSDDIEWCKENFIGEKYMFADKPYYCSQEIDLYIMTQCKANVISNSTFGWWGAFLNKNSQKVVCHWPWFSKGNPMKNILPENWIKFEFHENYQINQNKSQFKPNTRNVIFKKKQNRPIR